MRTNFFRHAGGIVALFILGAAGCAGSSKQRMTMLEDNNRMITAQLNRLRADLGSCNQESASLNQKLSAAVQESEALRDQLANVPTYEPVAQGWTPVQGGAMIAIEGSVLFAPGKAQLRDGARRTLDGIVSTLQGEYGDQDIFVFGHTDNRPIKKSGWDDNWQLSTERALAVVRYLGAHNVDAIRMVAGGCGQNRPIVDNDSASNRSTNRRVEIFAMDPHILSN